MRQLQNTVFSVLFSMVGVSSLQAASPGGVSAGLEAWYRADAGTNVNALNNFTASGGSAWDDQSANGYNIDSVTGDPQLQENGLNFNPAVHWDGGDYMRYYYGTAFFNTFTAGEQFGVAREADPITANHGFFHYFGGHSGTTAWYTYGEAIYDQFGSSTFNRRCWTPGVPAVVSAGYCDSTGASVSGPSVVTTDWNIFASGIETNLYEAYFNGTLAYSDTSPGTINFNSGYNLHLGAHPGAIFTGHTAEHILYSQKLSAADRQKVDSYLALKYGITLDQTVAATDYLASDGTTKMWSSNGYDAAYNHDIFGIGRDDASELDQRISTSVNQNSTLIVSTDNNFTASNTDHTSRPTQLNNLQFLAFASNGVSITARSYDFPVGGTYEYMGMLARSWQVQNPGSVGEVHLKFDGFGEGWYLLVDESNDDFASGVTAEIPLGADGNVSYTFGDGDYFTLAKLRYAPGGVGENVLAWVKADDGALSGDGSYVSLWRDQSGYFNDMHSGTDGYNNDYYRPQFYDNKLNFNPSLYFDGTGPDFLGRGNWLYFKDDVFFVHDSPYSVFVVAQDERTALGTRQGILGMGEDGNYPALDVYFSAASDPRGYRVWMYGSNPVEQTNTTTSWHKFYNSLLTVNPYDNRQPQLFGLTTANDWTASNASDGNIFLYLDGNISGTQLDSFQQTQLGRNIWIGSSGTAQAWKGQIAEVIVYFKDLHDPANALQTQMIQSYLALKYGITLQQPYCYIASDGVSRMWSCTDYDPDYNHDIFGLGRDNVISSLNQHISRSVNKGSVLIASLDNDFTSSNTDPSRSLLGNLEFISFANNGDPTTTQTTEIDKNLYKYRISREWQVQIHNITTPPEIYLKFDGFDENWILLRDQVDGDFSSDAEEIGSLDENGIIAVTLADGDYLTLASAGECTATTTLNDMEWREISFPCVTGDNGIEALLGGSLGTYGNEAQWVMYEQTGDDSWSGHNTADMRLMNATDPVVPGKGYWIITDTADGNPVTVRIDNTLTGLVKTATHLASADGISDNNTSKFEEVHTYGLPDSLASNWRKIMLGNPFNKAFDLEDLYYKHGSNAFEAWGTDDTYVNGTLYYRAGDHYEAISLTPGFNNPIEPMQGFWIKLNAGAGTNSIDYPLTK